MIVWRLWQVALFSLLSSFPPAQYAHSLCHYSTKEHKHTGCTLKQSPSLFCFTLYHSAAWGAVLADLHWLLWAIPYPQVSVREKRKKKKFQAFAFIKPTPAGIEPRRASINFILFFGFSFHLILVCSSTNNSHVPNSPEGAVIPYLSVVIYNKWYTQKFLRT